MVFMVGITKCARHKLQSRYEMGRSQRARGLRRTSAAARLLRFWVRIPPGARKSVCCECCVLWGRGLCLELITRPEKSYWLWCVVVCDLETSWMRRPWPNGGCYAKRKKYEKGVRILLHAPSTEPPVPESQHHSPYGHFGEKINLLPSCGLSNQWSTHLAG